MKWTYAVGTEPSCGLMVAKQITATSRDAADAEAVDGYVRFVRGQAEDHGTAIRWWVREGGRLVGSGVVEPPQR